MELNKAIRERHSVRRFKSQIPDWRDIFDCIDSMRYSPMAGGNFTLKFILVDDKEKIIKLAEAAQQNFIQQTSYVLVVCSDLSRTVNAYEKRGEIYCRQQAGAAIQNFLLNITEKKLSTCWIGHFIEEQVKRTLRIPEEINVEAMFPIGYEFKKPLKKRVKSDLDKALYFNIYKNTKRKPRLVEGVKVGRAKEKEAF